jgi:pyruvate dehydrogenase E1 component
MLHPQEIAHVPYVTQQLEHEAGVFVAATDYDKAVPDLIARWVPRPLFSLGTDGFGRSDGRAALRDFFEVDAKHIALATLSALLRDKKIKSEVVAKAIKELDVNPESPNPLIV